MIPIIYIGVECKRKETVGCNSYLKDLEIGMREFADGVCIQDGAGSLIIVRLITNK